MAETKNDDKDAPAASVSNRLLGAGYTMTLGVTIWDQVQELMGHGSVRTTQRYLHVLNQGGGIVSPLDE